MDVLGLRDYLLNPIAPFIDIIGLCGLQDRRESHLHRLRQFTFELKIRGTAYHFMCELGGIQYCTSLVRVRLEPDSCCSDGVGPLNNPCQVLRPCEFSMSVEESVEILRRVLDTQIVAENVAGIDTAADIVNPEFL